MLARLKAHIQKFFFSPSKTHTLVWLRSMLGVFSLVRISSFFLEHQNFFGPEGWFDFEHFRDDPSASVFNIFYHLGQFEITTTIIFTLIFALSFWLVAGFSTRIVAAALFYLWWSLFNRNYALSNYGDEFFSLLLFMMIGADSAQPDKNSPWVLRLIQIQITLIYLSNVILKLGLSDLWMSGAAAYYVFNIEYRTAYSLPGINESPLWSMLYSWMSLAAEALMSIGLWFAWPLRVFVLVVAVTYHLTLEYTMRIPGFQFIMLIGLLSFVPIACSPAEVFQRFNTAFKRRMRRKQIK